MPGSSLDRRMEDSLRSTSAAAVRRKLERLEGFHTVYSKDVVSHCVTGIFLVCFISDLPMLALPTVHVAWAVPTSPE